MDGWRAEDLGASDFSSEPFRRDDVNEAIGEARFVRPKSLLSQRFWKVSFNKGQYGGCGSDAANEQKVEAQDKIHSIDWEKFEHDEEAHQRKTSNKGKTHSILQDDIINTVPFQALTFLVMLSSGAPVLTERQEPIYTARTAV